MNTKGNLKKALSAIVAVLSLTVMSVGAMKSNEKIEKIHISIFSDDTVLKNIFGFLADNEHLKMRLVCKKANSILPYYVITTEICDKIFANMSLAEKKEYIKKNGDEGKFKIKKLTLNVDRYGNLLSSFFDVCGKDLRELDLMRDCSEYYPPNYPPYHGETDGRFMRDLLGGGLFEPGMVRIVLFMLPLLALLALLAGLDHLASDWVNWANYIFACLISTDTSVVEVLKSDKLKEIKCLKLFNMPVVLRQVVKIINSFPKLQELTCEVFSYEKIDSFLEDNFSGKRDNELDLVMHIKRGHETYIARIEPKRFVNKK